jgi:hypothetical protein
MTEDPLTPIQTTGSAPTQPGEPEKHRSVADGELAAPWTLTQFFHSLNSVMRLPTKARRRVERAQGASFTLPGLGRPWVSRAILVGGFAVVVGILVVRPLLLWASRTGHDSLRPVVGVWEAGKGKYRGRSFEMSDSTVSFQYGEKASDYTWHRIEEVRVKPVGDSVLYTVRYAEGQKVADLSFWYQSIPTPVIRLKNQPDVVWSKSTRAPTAQPR